MTIKEFISKMDKTTFESCEIWTNGGDDEGSTILLSRGHIYPGQVKLMEKEIKEFSIDPNNDEVFEFYIQT